MSWQSAFGGRRALVWALPLALVAANLAWVVLLGGGARLRSAELERRLERARHEREEVVGRLAERERQWVTATTNRERLSTLYRDRFATEESRFTDTVRELKELARRAGLEPAAIGYPREALAEFGLVRKSFVFGVAGSYADLRTFLHLLELTPTFLTIDQIAVDDGARRLAVRLRMSTYFARDADPAPRAAGAGS